MTLLNSFGLSDRSAYTKWWDDCHCTNYHVSLGPRFAWVVSQLPDAPASILEIGSQTGGFTLPLLKSGYKVTAVDVVKENLGIIRANAMKEGVAKGLKTVHSFAEDLQFEDAFDTVLLCEVLIHCSDDKWVLEKAFQAVKPGGRLIVTVPWYDLYKGKEISRYYSKESFAAILPEGTEVVEMKNDDGSIHTFGAVLTK
jgi:2-polyprenyl-3-methyl-5-hydroxy-6-metoxy-1,4-benzoquinol methylase